MSSRQLPNCDAKKCTPEQVDLLISDVQDLVKDNHQSYAWYCKAAYVLGAATFMRVASIARQEGKNPPRLFSYLLKKEMQKIK